MTEVYNYRIGSGAGPEVPDDALPGLPTPTFLGCPSGGPKFGVVWNSSWPKVSSLSSFTSMAILPTAHRQAGNAINSSEQRTGLSQGPSAWTETYFVGWGALPSSFTAVSGFLLWDLFIFCFPLPPPRFEQLPITGTYLFYQTCLPSEVFFSNIWGQLHNERNISEQLSLILEKEVWKKIIQSLLTLVSIGGRIWVRQEEKIALSRQDCPAVMSSLLQQTWLDFSILFREWWLLSFSYI